METRCLWAGFWTKKFPYELLATDVGVVRCLAVSRPRPSLLCRVQLDFDCVTRAVELVFNVDPRE